MRAHKTTNTILKSLCGIINTLHTLFLPSFRSLRSSFSSSVTFLSRMPLSFVFELFSFFSGFSTLPPPRVMASSSCCCLRSSCLELCGHTRVGRENKGRLFGEQQLHHPTWPAGPIASSFGVVGLSFTPCRAISNKENQHCHKTMQCL